MKANLVHRTTSRKDAPKHIESFRTLEAANCQHGRVTSFQADSGLTWSYDPEGRLGDDSGMGQVFRGTGPDGRQVAVKRVQLRIGDRADIRRRDRELEIHRALAAVPGEHVLRGLDFGWDGSDFLLVLPLAERSLAAALSDGQMSVAERLEAIAEVAQGLVELGSASILHRDLKPANVLSVDGKWLLADFGISRSQLEATATYTFLGAGTWPYMAPEIWNGQPATTKSDLYAFGVLAFEVLTGGRPFGGPHESDFRYQHLFVTPPILNDYDPGIQRLVLRLLDKDPAARHQSAADVVEALRLATTEPGDDGLGRAALLAQQRRAETSARLAETQARDAERANRRRQALGDLEQIVADAAAIARRQLHDVEFRGDDAQLHVIWDTARVTFAAWPRAVVSQDADDPAVLAGAVYSSARPGELVANIVCERSGSAMVWYYLRFTSSPLVGANYRYGPIGVPHGFSETRFAQERVFMVHRAMHVWQMERTPLTTSVVSGLLQEAINAM